MIFGDVKKSSKLKRILVSPRLEEFPYDGIEITITEDKKLYYMITEIENTPLSEKKVVNYMNQQTKKFFKDDYQIINMSDGLIKEKRYNLDQEEYPSVSKLFYGEILITDTDYKELYKKLKKLDISLKEYYEKQVIPSRRVESLEMVSKLDYVTEISILDNKAIYWKEEEEMLQNNEIYLHLKEIEKEVINYIEKINLHD